MPVKYSDNNNFAAYEKKTVIPDIKNNFVIFKRSDIGTHSQIGYTANATFKLNTGGFDVELCLLEIAELSAFIETLIPKY